MKSKATAEAIERREEAEWKTGGNVHGNQDASDDFGGRRSSCTNSSSSNTSILREIIESGRAKLTAQRPRAHLRGPGFDSNTENGSSDGARSLSSSSSLSTSSGGELDEVLMFNDHQTNGGSQRSNKNNKKIPSPPPLSNVRNHKLVHVYPSPPTPADSSSRSIKGGGLLSPSTSFSLKKPLRHASARTLRARDDDPESYPNHNPTVLVNQRGERDAAAHESRHEFVTAKIQNMDSKRFLILSGGHQTTSLMQKKDPKGSIKAAGSPSSSKEAKERPTTKALRPTAARSSLMRTFTYTSSELGPKNVPSPFSQSDALSNVMEGARRMQRLLDECESIRQAIVRRTVGGGVDKNDPRIQNNGFGVKSSAANDREEDKSKKQHLTGDLGSRALASAEAMMRRKATLEAHLAAETARFWSNAPAALRQAREMPRRFDRVDAKELEVVAKEKTTAEDRSATFNRREDQQKREEFSTDTPPHILKNQTSRSPTIPIAPLMETGRREEERRAHVLRILRDIHAKARTAESADRVRRGLPPLDPLLDPPSSSSDDDEAYFTIVAQIQEWEEEERRYQEAEQAAEKEKRKQDELQQQGQPQQLFGEQTLGVIPTSSSTSPRAQHHHPKYLGGSKRVRNKQIKCDSLDAIDFEAFEALREDRRRLRAEEKTVTEKEQEEAAVKGELAKVMIVHENSNVAPHEERSRRNEPQAAGSSGTEFLVNYNLPRWLLSPTRDEMSRMVGDLLRHRREARERKEKRRDSGGGNHTNNNNTTNNDKSQHSMHAQPHTPAPLCFTEREEVLGADVLLEPHVRTLTALGTPRQFTRFNYLIKCPPPSSFLLYSATPPIASAASIRANMITPTKTPMATMPLSPTPDACRCPSSSSDRPSALTPKGTKISDKDPCDHYEESTRIIAEKAKDAVEQYLSTVRTLEHGRWGARASLRPPASDNVHMCRGMHTSSRCGKEFDNTSTPQPCASSTRRSQALPSPRPRSRGSLEGQGLQHSSQNTAALRDFPHQLSHRGRIDVFPGNSDDNQNYSNMYTTQEASDTSLSQTLINKAQIERSARAARAREKEISEQRQQSIRSGRASAEAAKKQKVMKEHHNKQESGEDGVANEDKIPCTEEGNAKTCVRPAKAPSRTSSGLTNTTQVSSPRSLRYQNKHFSPHRADFAQKSYCTSRSTSQDHDNNNNRAPKAIKATCANVISKTSMAAYRTPVAPLITDALYTTCSSSGGPNRASLSSPPPICEHPSLSYYNDDYNNHNMGVDWRRDVHNIHVQISSPWQHIRDSLGAVEMKLPPSSSRTRSRGDFEIKSCRTATGALQGSTPTHRLTPYGHANGSHRPASAPLSVSSSAAVLRFGHLSKKEDMNAEDIKVETQAGGT